jgi:hypothetical protein
MATWTPDFGCTKSVGTGLACHLALPRDLEQSSLFLVVLDLLSPDKTLHVGLSFEIGKDEPFN